MEWLQQGSLLQPENWGVLKFSQTPSIVFKGLKTQKDTITYTSKPLVSDKDWSRWLDGEASSLNQLSKRSENLSHLKKGENNGENPQSRLTLLKLNASFNPMILQRTHEDLPVIVYNCRSSANWPGDLALSVTYCPGTNSTKGVLYGCNERVREQVVDHMSTCDYSSYHPLTLLTLFAEIERGRHFNLANPMVRKLMQRARNIATAHPPPAYIGASQPSGVIQEPEDYMQLWFEISCLKNGLQSWRQELQKMVSHCEDLTRAKFHISKRPPESTESTPVNTILSVDVFDSGDAGDTPVNEVEDLTLSGRRIRQRLLEIQGEYDEKIRECGMIIEGMVLAAQLEWNNIGQSDTRTNQKISSSNLEIARATREDGQQMRSIAMLTMIFLPATFVASLFSMSFFDWNPDQGKKILSPYIWMYVVLTAGLTGLTLTLWYFFGRPHLKEKGDCDDVESQGGSRQQAVEK
ncbi:hypothetical protein J7T55_002159 [Diaporthe amygdali]|uniref:uncharacterized protein n=1 Tax=Phomopsis amygdali TaxID=1214568 RepID=UPI0022FE3928|nr:uncharacterized protein J7T55_002159 [Diaporthe amygdali]KAJ0108555.1 hypothetical protein J7T55_002159 [Diaporthe amygdali]